MTTAGRLRGKEDGTKGIHIRTRTYTGPSPKLWLGEVGPGEEKDGLIHVEEGLRVRTVYGTPYVDIGGGLIQTV